MAVILTIYAGKKCDRNIWRFFRKIANIFSENGAMLPEKLL
jgi:hypothetical protein